MIKIVLEIQNVLSIVFLCSKVEPDYVHNDKGCDGLYG